jgi:hypothetical protein
VTAVDISQPSTTTVPPRIRLLLTKIAFWCVIADLALAALLGGLRLRSWAWLQSEPIRYEMDIDNAFRQGTKTLRIGYLNVYDDHFQAHQEDGAYDLDYSPGRLLVATLWTRWVRIQVDGPGQDWELISDWPQQFYDRARQLNRQNELCRPLLIVNDCGEIAAAIAMFVLVRHWTARRYRPPTAVVLGLICAIFFWFNVELIWNAHCWAQSDCLLLPFFLWALAAASADFWCIAGIVIAAGAMFKSQILFGAPLLILWPLWRLNFLAIVRFCVGLFTATATLTAPWMVRNMDHANHSAIWWVIGFAAAVGQLIPVMHRRWRWYVKSPLIAVSAAVILGPLFHAGWIWVLCAAAAIGALCAFFRYTPKRAWSYALATSIAAALFLCVPIFNGSMSWFQIGIAYGTRHYLRMGSNSNDNLPAIMEQQWDWHLLDPATTLPPGRLANTIGWILDKTDHEFNYERGQPVSVPVKYVLVCAYALSLLICSIGAAVHDASGSPRFLIAITAPWIVFFTVLPQMHERYLIWGAAISAATVALGPGMALLHLLITAIAVSMEIEAMAWAYKNTPLLQFIDGWHPGVAWALMLCCGIYLYLSIVPDRRRSHGL